MRKNIRVLLVEDSSDDALLVIHELERSSFCTQWERVQNATELRTILLTQPWDIVLSDYTMPQFNAIEALKIIREVDQDLPCIIISGTIGEEVAVAAMQAGAKDFFVKGNLTRLCSAVRRQLAEAENIRERGRAEQNLRESEQRRWAEREEALIREKEARKKIETLYQEAQESNRLKEEFLHNLSHELRTPMNAITGWAELLANGECDVSNYPRAFSTIYQNALIQNKRINDLLDLSQIITGQFKIENRLLKFEQVVRAALESSKLQAQAKNILLSLKLNSSNTSVTGDFGRLQEVVWNLLSNAVKFTPNGGRIDLEINRQGFMLELKVCDTGEGIDSAFLPYVFDRFRQADGSLTRRHGGLGLGLSIVRNIVELHGGRVEAQSAGIGKGTTLIVQLPLSDVQLSEGYEEKTSPPEL